MSVKTSNCLSCDVPTYESTLSMRGWCIGCEREFARITTQREARRLLQLPMEFEENPPPPPQAHNHRT